MDFKIKLLNYFNINEKLYKELSKPVNELTLPNPNKFEGMEKAKNIINEAIKHDDKIVIYGDYDCDGIMSTSIMLKCFNMLNYRVGYYVPSRYIDGYGLNEKRVQDFYEKGYKLIITVDNGIAQFEAIKKAYELGMKVIVTDHHEQQENLPEAEVILHPIISNYGNVVCCGAYVAFMLASSLLNKCDKYLLSLASIATISDMMPLKEYNRDIVRLGIYYMNNNHYYPISLLADNSAIDENVIGLKIAPKINAVGRMIETTSINSLIEYFVTNNKERIDTIYNFINETNEKLKEIDELPDLIKFMTKYMGEEDSEFNVIIVDNEKIHEINKTYRNIDRETDVISFALNDDETCNSFVRVLGDIYISIDKAKSQAEEYGHSLKRELSFLTVHGFLHLLGYDHMEKEDEIKMFSLQNEILKEYGVNR